jgi:hypothetical protein
MGRALLGCVEMIYIFFPLLSYQRVFLFVTSVNIIAVIDHGRE